MLRQRRNLNIGNLVRGSMRPLESQDFLERKIPLEEWDKMTFDLDLDPSFLESYKKKNLRYSGGSIGEHLVKDLLFRFFGNKETPTIDYGVLKKVLSARNSTRVAILNAHGGNLRGSWVYGDKESNIPVQQWIQEISSRNSRTKNKYGVLIIGSCNRTSLEPTVIDLPIFYPKGILGPNEPYQTCFLENTKL